MVADQNQKLIYTNKDDENQVRFYYENEVIDLVLPGKLRLYGNIMIKFYFSSSFAFTPQELFRITFNTAFVPVDNRIEVDRFMISPEDLSKDYNRFTNEFRCQLTFKDYCFKENAAGCRSHKTPLEKICHKCKAIMLDEVDRWYEATKILINHKPISQDESR